MFFFPIGVIDSSRSTTLPIHEWLYIKRDHNFIICWRSICTKYYTNVKEYNVLRVLTLDDGVSAKVIISERYIAIIYHTSHIVY